MAQGPIKAETPRWIEVDIGEITIGSAGYTSIASYRPSGITIANTAIATWGTASPSVAFNVNAAGTYLFGTSGMVIRGLKLRYYY